MIDYITKTLSPSSPAPSTSPDSPPEQSPSPEDFHDCTPCRVMGGVTFIGLGLYCITIKEEETRPAFNPKSRFARSLMRYRGRVPVGVGAVFVALGAYRLVR